MIKKIIVTLLLGFGLLQAASVETDKNEYQPNEEITALFEDLRGEGNDWAAIYPADATNEFQNIIQWQLTGGNVNGTVKFNIDRAGTYNVRIFYGADHTVNSLPFTIVGGENNEETNVSTTKDIYALEEEVIANYENTDNQNGDWMGIYPAGSNNEWQNVVAWSWLTGGTSGTVNFGALPGGEYEVRVFFNHTFDMEASYPFIVQAPELTVQTRKNNYNPYELIHVDFENMRGVESDWIGIFAVGAAHGKENAIEWRDANSLVNGERSFNGIPAGNYEARVYFDNLHKKTHAFTVDDIAIERVLYDDFEDGIIDPRWVRVAGKDMTINNYGVNPQGVASTERKVKINGQKSLRTYRDYRGGQNHSGYYFNFENPDSKLRFLEIDMSIGESSHVFAFGIKVKTKFGDRRIEFASWLNHTMPDGRQIIRGPYGNVLLGHRQAFTQDNYLFVHPGPSDYYVGTSGVGSGQNMMIHYKINIEEKLRLMEPDNELLGVTLFTTSGGDYDNLALTTH